MAEFYIEKVPRKQKSRYDQLESTFTTIYNKNVEIFARSPGRVNLIGEHLDYCGYGVLPMALEQDLVMACAHSSENMIKLSNCHVHHKDYSCKTADININTSDPEWHDYFLCAVKGFIQLGYISNCAGLEVLVTSTIPESAGLSSSSALVCCAALTIMYLHNLQLTKIELSEVCEYCENLIGTEGGGMDQAIAILAQPGTAKFIEFYPLKCSDVQLPNEAVFVICNSCSDIHKAATNHFSERVVECRLACQILGKSKGLNWRDVMKFKDLQMQLGFTLLEMISLTEEFLHKEPYDLKEVCEVLKVSIDELQNISFLEKTLAASEFKLYDRAIHVFKEANRVLEFKSLCESSTVDCLTKLGDLMYESHDSCQTLFECSSSELDEIVDLAKTFGALGCRLTGAGWGGCAVALLHESQVEGFINYMKKEYYQASEERRQLVDEALFATFPSGGSQLYCQEAV